MIEDFDQQNSNEEQYEEAGQQTPQQFVAEEERKMLLINLLFKDNSLLMEKFNERYDANSEINKSLKRLHHIKDK